ncbi:MAG: hypothetical protein ACE5OP_02205 [Candidatus Glassbacteria bacterium]
MTEEDHPLALLITEYLHYMSYAEEGPSSQEVETISFMMIDVRVKRFFTAGGTDGGD